MVNKSADIGSASGGCVGCARLFGVLQARGRTVLEARLRSALGWCFSARGLLARARAGFCCCLLCVVTSAGALCWLCSCSA
ncbi:hypothetical protein L484_019922 [Morus notabilis]|uniref:Uncharacterized protein n=1 Tax=Morus notabilis TaxID=981085 RepID=W9QUT1_9ROSA|nr:hypothetical protein L484_019922 [Morus notabilis]